MPRAGLNLQYLFAKKQSQYANKNIQNYLKEIGNRSQLRLKRTTYTFFIKLGKISNYIRSIVNIIQEGLGIKKS